MKNEKNGLKWGFFGGKIIEAGDERTHQPTEGVGKMKLAQAMKKAINYFEKNKPEGAQIRTCEPWEMAEGSRYSFLIKIGYAKRNSEGEMVYTESDRSPFLVHIVKWKGEEEIY